MRSRSYERWLLTLAGCAVLLGSGLLVGVPALQVGTTSGAPGSTVQVPVDFTVDTNVVSLQFDLLYSTNYLTAATPAGGSALADHQLASAEVTPGTRRVLIFSFSNAPLTNGVLAYVPMAVASGAPDHDEALALTNVVLANSNATQMLPVSTTDGTLRVLIPPWFSAIGRTNGVVHLDSLGTPGRSYVLEATTNAEQPQWISLATNTASAGGLQFDDATGGTSPARFYRAWVAP